MKNAWIERIMIFPNVYYLVLRPDLSNELHFSGWETIPKFGKCQVMKTSKSKRKFYYPITPNGLKKLNDHSSEQKRKNADIYNTP